MTFKVSGGISFILSRDDVVTEKTVNWILAKMFEFY